MVGVERFELPTHCSQSSCATRLRYTPKPVNLSMLRTPLFCVNPFPSYWATKNPINSKGHPCMDGLVLDPFRVRRIMARPERFELPTARFVAGYSIQLSYGRTMFPHETLCFARAANYPREAPDCQPLLKLISHHFLCSSRRSFE
jgi:hypothetical protein